MARTGTDSQGISADVRDPDCPARSQAGPGHPLGFTPTDGSQFVRLERCERFLRFHLPEALMAALPLRDDGQVIAVGDHRQMPPIVHHDWEREYRRTFRQYEVYSSLFDTMRVNSPPMIQFAESFRLHASIADFLRQEIYQHDGIEFHSRKRDVLTDPTHDSELVTAVLRPEYPLVVVVHDEADSQVRNPFEQSLIEPIIRTLADKAKYALDAEEGQGVVVPHRAQRAALQEAFPELCIRDPTSGLTTRSAIDTVERFQGGERTVILISSTESIRSYLLMSSEFLLDPRRPNVALSRAKRKLILVTSQTIFSLSGPDEERFLNSFLWKNLLMRTCTERLWEGLRQGRQVIVWGAVALSGRAGRIWYLMSTIKQKRLDRGLT
jgi:superfamily I DNA and/or RNA helicase